MTTFKQKGFDPTLKDRPLACPKCNKHAWIIYTSGDKEIIDDDDSDFIIHRLRLSNFKCAGCGVVFDVVFDKEGSQQV